MRPLQFVTSRLNDKYEVTSLETGLSIAAYVVFLAVFLGMIPYYMLIEISVTDTVSSLKILDGYECTIQAVLNGSPLGSAVDRPLTFASELTAICPNIPTKAGTPAGSINGCCGSGSAIDDQARTDYVNVYFPSKAACHKELGDMSGSKWTVSLSGTTSRKLNSIWKDGSASVIPRTFLVWDCPTATNDQIKAAYTAFWQKHLCKSYEYMPPYVCTKTTLEKPNGFLAALSLAFAQSQLFFGILIMGFAFLINRSLPEHKNEKALMGSEDTKADGTQADGTKPGVSGQTPGGFDVEASEAGKASE